MVLDLAWLIILGLSLLQEGSWSPDFLNLTALNYPYEHPSQVIDAGTCWSCVSPDRIRAPDWALREVPDPLNQDRFSRLQTVFLPFSGTVFCPFPVPFCIHVLPHRVLSVSFAMDMGTHGQFGNGKQMLPALPT